jgi:heptosyltransferase-2
LELSGIRAILVLQLQQLGDSVVFTPALRALRERFPDARLDMLCGPISFELYRKCRYLDNIYVHRPLEARRQRTREFFSLMRTLRRVHYDLAVADVTQTAAWYATVAWLAGAPQRIGFDVDHRGFLFTTRLQPPAESNFVDCNLSIARMFGMANPSPAVECFFDEDDRQYAEFLLGNTMGSGPIIGVHPASNWQSKTWFPERWATVADALVSEHGASIIYVGTSKEHQYIDDIIGRMKAPARSVAGETTLSQLAALLSRCDLFVGTDSGPRHIAAGTGISQVTVMSSQDRPARWNFKRDQEVILRTDPSCSPCLLNYCSHRQCMVEITEARVLGACRHLLLGLPIRVKSTNVSLQDSTGSRMPDMAR